MYNYDFLKNKEKVIYENNNTYVDIFDESLNLSMLITNKNILFFKNYNDNNVLNGRGLHLLPDYLLFLSIPLNKMKYNIKDNNTIINYDNTEIVIYDININDYL